MRLRRLPCPRSELATLILAAMDSALVNGEWDTGEHLLRAMEALCLRPEDANFLDGAYLRIARRLRR